MSIAYERPKTFSFWVKFSVTTKQVAYLVTSGAREKVYEVVGMGMISYWNKFSEIFRIQRVRYGNPYLWENTEYLYEELKKISVLRKGYLESENMMKPYSYKPESSASP